MGFEDWKAGLERNGATVWSYRENFKTLLRNSDSITLRYQGL